MQHSSPWMSPREQREQRGVGSARRFEGTVFGVVALASAFGCAPADEQPGGAETGAPPQVAWSVDGVVVAAQPLAAEAGAEMLRSGGNAADAAVAAAFAVSVVEPSMNSIGGRTQILVRLPDGTFAGIDATTQAPATYDPETAPQASYGYPTVGVPGAVAGLAKLLREHGTKQLADVMAPAIALAEDGFPLLPGEARRHRAGAGQLAEFEGSRAHFLTPGGNTRTPGETFVQPDLAATLRTISKGGADAFYRGALAERIAEDMEAHGGAVTLRSLADYRAMDASIVRGNYRGYDLVGTDIPASGAATIGVLHILENFDMASLDRDSWAALVGTAVARAFEERAAIRESGADDLVSMTDKAWAAEIAAGIEVPGAVRRAADAAPSKASAEAAMADWGDNAWGPSNSHTTHLSAADGDGMYVSLTQTIGPNLGSKVATPGLGFLYAATLGGYLGYMEPGERARSSISPLMVLQDGELLLVLGAAGGARIISAVVQAVLRVVDQGMSLPDALAAARVHPIDGGISMEMSPGIGWGPEVVAEVESWGMEVQEVEREGAFGRIHGIWVDRRTGEKVGVADPDWEGAAIVPGREAPVYDIVLQGGQVLDGTGAPARRADIAFTDGLIAAVGDLGGAAAETVLDVAGLYVSPGFIDTHSHAGSGLATPELSHAEPLLAQGLATVVVNPDGGGPVDLAAQRAELEADGLGVNAAQLVPHGSIRRQIVGMEDRAPTDGELDAMEDLVRAGMEAGAWGLSSGTFYAPGSWSENSELVALARVAGEYGGIYTSHIRDESNYTIGVVAAVEEVIELGRDAGITAVVTHVKALGPPVWGSSAAIVESIDAARAEGLSIYADQYPYLASATGLSAALLPRWSQEGDDEAFAERVADPETSARIRDAMAENLARRGGADRIQFRRFTQDPSIEGRLLSDLAEERGKDPVDVALELILQGGPSIVSFNMSDEDLRRLMTQDWTMTSSDGGLPQFGVGVPHPRSYGAFARKIGKFVFEDGVMTLEAAIRTMTALPAEVMGMEDRGRIKEGMVADIVVFSEDFRDNATFTDPHQLSSGVVHLFVGGEAAIMNSAFTGRRTGQVLTRCCADGPR